MLSRSVVSDSATPRLLCPWDSLDKNTQGGCNVLLQGIFLTQGSNPSLPHCRWIIYCLSPGKPMNTGIGNLSLLQGIFLTQEWNRGLLHGRQILYQVSYQGSPIGMSKYTYLQESVVPLKVNRYSYQFLGRWMGFSNTYLGYKTSQVLNKRPP